MSKHQVKSSDYRQQKSNGSRQTTNVNSSQKTQQGTGASNLSRGWQQTFNNPTSKLQPQTTSKRK